METETLLSIADPSRNPTLWDRLGDATPQTLAEFCRRWQIEELAVFGSVLRGDFRPDSDVDFLATFQPTVSHDLGENMQMREELATLLHRPVDLLNRQRTENHPNPFIRRNVLSSAKPLTIATVNEELIMPKTNRDPASLQDIVNASREILDFIGGVSREQFNAQETIAAMRRSAVQMQLTIIGEAIKRLSSEFRQAHPAIPWQQIAGMRDNLIHNYDDTDWDIVWKSATVEVPALLPYVEPLVPSIEDSHNTNENENGNGDADDIANA